MKKILLLLIFSILFSVNSFAKKEPYIGEILYGNIGPFGLGTEILLPEGEWVVAGVTVSNGSVRWAELVLLQIESDKIKALLNIKYPRKLEAPINEWGTNDGWRRDKHFDNNTCDDYDGQNSNYHETLIKKVLGGQRIIRAVCLSVHGISNFNPNRKFSSKSWRMAHDYVERVNLNYPNNLVFVDTTFFRLTNMVHVYFATNPEFILSKSRQGSPSEGNPWSKGNITKNDDKNKFMSDVIMIGQNTMSNNIDDFIDGKRLDFFRFNDLIRNK